MTKSAINSEEQELAALPICNRCKHHISGTACVAFLHNIPDEILFGENDHSKPMAGQGNTITFEPTDGNKK